jgi:hypothetical protein
MDDNNSDLTGEDRDAPREFRRSTLKQGVGHNSDWKPVDWIACCFTVVLGVILVIGSISVIVRGDGANAGDEQKMKIMAGIISSVISIVSMYVGASIQKRRDQ